MTNNEDNGKNVHVGAACFKIIAIQFFRGKPAS
jgi:hypothetical protein